MSVLQWFGIGVGCAAALWWWRYIVQRAIWDDVQGRSAGDNPSAFEGMFWGTVIWAFSPVWLPIYGAAQLYKKHQRALDTGGYKVNRALLRAFPERRP